MKINRRKFIAAATTLSAGFPAIVRGQGLNERLQVGFVATGGKAVTHIKESHDAKLQCVAFADVDNRVWENVTNKKGWEQATGYSDWREMFTKHQEELDVVFVTTPDHNHFAPTMTAVAMGIHCYTEKPLTWSVREAQLLTNAYAQQKDVVTQMGNQGHSMRGWRLANAYIKAGAIGEIKEFHTWTDRPRWPQGGERPDYTSPVPDHLNWDAWVGSAPMRPFAGPPEGSKKKGRDGRLRGPYHPFNWRGIVDFGAGALGDMACHTTDGIYGIMNPGYAETAEPLEMTSPVGDQFPAGMVVKNTYRATAERGGFATFWYEGKNNDGKPYVPETPEELKADGAKLPRTGNLIIGTEGKMLVQGDYWNTPRIIPDARHEQFEEPTELENESPGHHKEFFTACRGDKPREFSQSNFSYSGPMTANIQLGNLCARAGKKLELNEAGEIVNDPEINAMAWREPREGWGPLESIG